jgi:hypothetical protein
MKKKPKKATYTQADAIHSLTSPEISIPLHSPPDSSMSRGFWRLKLATSNGTINRWDGTNKAARARRVPRREKRDKTNC